MFLAFASLLTSYGSLRLALAGHICTREGHRAADPVSPQSQELVVKYLLAHHSREVN